MQAGRVRARWKIIAILPWVVVGFLFASGPLARIHVEGLRESDYHTLRIYAPNDKSYTLLGERLRLTERASPFEQVSFGTDEIQVAQRLGLTLPRWYTSSILLRYIEIWAENWRWALLVLAICIPILAVRRLAFLRRHKRQLGLLYLTNELARRLDFEITKTRTSDYGFAATFGMTTKYARSDQLKARPLSLPGLTSEYIKYMNQVLQVLSRKVIICIDELDKVSDVEQVRFILREIKGALYVRGSFYIVSVAEDAIATFETRMAAQRDIFESTFDEIFTVSPLDIASCHQICDKRLTVADLKPLNYRGISILATLCGGNARELIRNLRDASLAARMKRGKSCLSPEEVWFLVFDKKYMDTLERLSAAPVDRMDEFRCEVINELRSLADVRESSAAIQSVDCAVKLLSSRLRSNKKRDGERELLQRWLRLVLELKIFALTLRCHQLSMTDESFDSQAEALQVAYSKLPYSIMACRSMLSSA
jgi:hypothetical protein